MKNALITGSSRGIGAEEARELARRGWSVNLNWHESGEAAAALSRELGCPAYRADVADPEQVAAMFSAVGGVELLVCNAGIAYSGLVQEMTSEAWRRIFAVNVEGAFNCCRAAIPHMVHNKRGCIVLTSSILAVHGGSCEAAYSASKGAIIALTKSLAKELGPSGIRVNAVAPGSIDTDMLACFTSEDKQRMADASALCRIGTTQDVARAVAFLASDEADFITGQILGVDGNMIV